jgi:hypoxanthine phosphoribosyltransferase
MKEIVSYKDFVLACKIIAEKLPLERFTDIYGIPRGGLVPAVYLSHLTGLPLTEYPQYPTTLVVDDIADTGHTLEELDQFFIATIYYHKQSIVKPDIWVYEKKKKWIVFPWEKEALE